MTLPVCGCAGQSARCAAFRIQQGRTLKRSMTLRSHRRRAGPRLALGRNALVNARKFVEDRHRGRACRHQRLLWLVQCHSHATPRPRGRPHRLWLSPPGLGTPVHSGAREQHRRLSRPPTARPLPLHGAKPGSNPIATSSAPTAQLKSPSVARWSSAAELQHLNGPRVHFQDSAWQGAI